MNEELEISALFDLDKSIARGLFEGLRFPWEALEKIGVFIVELGESLPSDRFIKKGENIWISVTARVAPTASINGPCIIDENAEIRHGAFIRGNAVIGAGAVVGNSCEIKNSVLFDGVQVPHYNYVGDSVLGAFSHLGAGAVTSNVKSDKSNVKIKIGDASIETGRKKCGAMLGDRAEIGCNAVLCPGSVIGRGSRVYPTVCVRGFVPGGCIHKGNEITKIRLS